MKIVIAAKHHRWTAWGSFARAFRALGHEVIGAGPRQPIPDTDAALREHPDAGLLLVFTTGYWPDTAPYRRRGIPAAYHVLNTEIQIANHLRHAPDYDVVFCPQRRSWPRCARPTRAPRGSPTASTPSVTRACPRRTTPSTTWSSWATWTRRSTRAGGPCSRRWIGRFAAGSYRASATRRRRGLRVRRDCVQREPRCRGEHAHLRGARGVGRLLLTNGTHGTGLDEVFERGRRSPSTRERTISSR